MVNRTQALVLGFFVLAIGLAMVAGYRRTGVWRKF
jgi:hypothetical protein